VFERPLAAVERPGDGAAALIGGAYSSVQLHSDFLPAQLTGSIQQTAARTCATWRSR
jgi:hypothetical protein